MPARVVRGLALGPGLHELADDGRAGRLVGGGDGAGQDRGDDGGDATAEATASERSSRPEGARTSRTEGIHSCIGGARARRHRIRGI